MKNNNRSEYYAKYKKTNYRRVPLDVRIQAYDAIKECADYCEMPVNTFIKKAIADAMKEKLTGTELESLLTVLPLLWSE